MNSQGKKFIIFTLGLDFKSGGSIVLYNLAKDLMEQDCNVKIYAKGAENSANIFCNHSASLEDVDDSTIVIYPEIVEGNPLKAKNVVRWILCDLGIHSKRDIYTTWGGQDLVFHFSSFNNKYDPHAIEKLYSIWINPAVQNKNLPRKGSCYLFKKASAFHRDIRLIHPMDAVMIDDCSNEEIIEIFNQKEYFYCYDPYAFYDVMAALCGCIPIVYPMTGMNKLNWLKSKANFQMYLDKRDNVAGIAYGIEDIPYAKDTLRHAEKEQREVVEFGKKTVTNFIHKTQTYFFNDKNSYEFKTVETLENMLKTHSIDRTVNIDLENLQQALREKNQEFGSLVQNFLKLKAENDTMRGSKFWKLRNLYRSILRKGP